MNDLVTNPPISYAAPASSLSAADAADLARLRAEERQRAATKLADIEARLIEVEAQQAAWLEADRLAEEDGAGKTPGAKAAKSANGGGKPSVPSAPQPVADVPKPRPRMWI